MSGVTLEGLQAQVAALETRCRAAETACAAAQALAESAEARFRYLADQAPMLIWIAGIDRTRHHFNRPWLEFRGRNLDQEFGSGWIQGILADDLPDYLKQYERAFDSREAFSLEYRLQRHDGEYRWMLDNGRPLYGPTGEFEGYIGSCIDITQHRRSEEQVLQLNSELTRQIDDFQTLVDTLPLPIAVAQNPQCDHVWINLSFAELLQLPAEANASMTGPSAQDFTFQFCRNGQPIPLDELPMRKAMATGLEIRDYEFDLVRKDGVKLNMFGHAIPLKDQKGEVRGCIAAWADITARKLAEESLRAADRRKDEFLAMLAHELRNPLAPLRSGLELLQLGGVAEDESLQILDMMHGQLMHVIRLVDDVLEVSRITRGRIELRTERLELHSALQPALETSQQILDELKHTLVRDLPSEPVYLKADPVRLTQIIANLLQNAAKYTDRGGRIELVVRKPPPIDPHSVLDAEKPNFVEIIVRDNGQGIDPAMLPHVFELFEQAGASDTTSRGGLGIGLMLTSKLVQLHGGSIRAESAGKGKGSTFTVLLPAAEPPESPAADSASRPNAGLARTIGGRSKRKILVVDDNRDAADTLGRLLSILQHEVRVEHDGYAAVAAVPQFQPDLVLLDLGMPGIDGIETARRILSSPAEKQPAIVALSGWGQEEDRRKTTEAGFAGHLLKPVDLGQLQNTIALLLPK